MALSSNVGKYALYKGEWFLVVDDRGNLALIINQDGVKRQVKFSNLQMSDKYRNKCKVVTYEGTKYLVTKSGKIISLLTNKFMKWDDKHPIRKGILELSSIERAKQVLKFTQSELAL